MKRELESELVKKYPKLFEQYGGDPRKTCMAWGCAHGDGWFALLDELCSKLSKFESVVFEQIKEKFGGLTIYISCEEHDFDQAHELIGEYYDKSKTVCETCGKPGQIRKGSWIHVACDDCHNKQ